MSAHMQPSQNGRWTKADYATLLAGLKKGRPIEQIARKLNRPVKSVLQKRWKLWAAMSGRAEPNPIPPPARVKVAKLMIPCMCCRKPFETANRITNRLCSNCRWQ